MNAPWPCTPPVTRARSLAAWNSREPPKLRRHSAPYKTRLTIAGRQKARRILFPDTGEVTYWYTSGAYGRDRRHYLSAQGTVREFSDSEMHIIPDFM